MHKATWNSAVLCVLALCLCQCSSSTSEPEVASDWLAWEDDLDFPTGRTFYLDPVDGNVANPGTQAEPLGSLQELLDHDLIQRYEAATHPFQDGAELVLANPDAPIQPGDTLVLLGGDHGFCRLVESHNPEFITIRAGEGQQPVLSGLELVGVERYRIQGLTLRDLNQDDVTRSLVHLESHNWRGPCRYVIIENCDISSQEDITAWSAADWASA